MHMGENGVALLGDSVEANNGDDFLWRLLCWRLSGRRIDLDGLACRHVDVNPLLTICNVGRALSVS